MPENLSPKERDTLMKLGAKGSGANLDQIALIKLFTLGLIEVNSDRRVVLTKKGQSAWDEYVRAGIKLVDDSGEDIPTIRK